MSKKANYEALRKEWYQKLKDEGFNDVESDEDNLKVWSSKLSRKHTVDQWQAKEAYYTMARSFLNEYAFTDEIERIIWTYHSEGISIRSIVTLLHDAKITKTYREQIFLTLKRLKETMRKMYSLSTEDEYHE